MPLNIKNFTHYANIRYASMDNRGHEFSVLIVKAAYDVQRTGECTSSEDQEPLIFTDEYHGALNSSAVRYPSDLVPFKPRTDVIFDFVTRSPTNQPERSWLVDVTAHDLSGLKVEKHLRVFGPRWWKPKWRRSLNDDERKNWRNHRKLFVGWELTEPEPVRELHIRYEYAFGGMQVTGQQSDGSPIYKAYEYNPIGRGWIDKEHTDHTQPVPAPQIEDPGDPIVDPYKLYAPVGLGPMPPAWLPRRPLGGTYDKNWIDNVWPKWPADYDFEYHNSAPADLRGPKGTFFEGDINVVLISRTDADKNVGKSIDYKMRVTNPTILLTEWSDGQGPIVRRLNLDTVFVDAADKDHNTWRIYVIGRAVLPFPIDAVVGVDRKQDWAKLPGETLREVFPPSRHPSEVV